VSEHELELTVAWQRHVGDDHRRLDALLARHREPHRRYHTVEHVAWVVRHVEELAAAEPAEHLDEVVAAAFFHDAVYEPGSAANERASAGVARRDLETLGWPVDRIERVAAMIEATEHGAPRPATHDTAILLDADLAVLAADPAGYATYAHGVRSEYGHLDDDEWRAGRTAVLQGFLERERIFLTATAHDRWEQRARANLTAELAALG
jgi:predicted metal-dependent HD superfamily phosphohydrolase